MSRDYDDEYDDDNRGEEESAENVPTDHPPVSSVRLVLPGILLIVTGVVNILLGLNFLGGGYLYHNMSVEEYEGVVAKTWSPEQRKQMEDAGYPPKVMKDLTSNVSYGWGALSLVGSLLSIIGGACMCARKARGLALAAAFTNALPCIASPCCLLGLPVGIWALVVLFQADVKAAFR